MLGPFKEVSAEEAITPLHGKSVAVVGNAPTVGDAAGEIDSHDFVIRMNKGTPKGGGPGKKMAVLCCGQIRPFEDVLAAPIPTLWWFKNTYSGARMVHQLGWWLHERKMEAYLFAHTKGLERYVMDKLKPLAPRHLHLAPSTGIRVLHLLTEWSGCSAITTFGMNFWGLDGGTSVSWTSGEGPHRHHNPRAEFNLFKKMGFERQRTGQWHRPKR